MAKVGGMMRMLQHGLGLDPESLMGRMMRRVLWPFVPKRYVAHMILGVGRKV